MTRIEVHKFGGTSLLNAERIVNAANLLIAAASTAEGTRICAVCSAMGGVTDQLLQCADRALEGESVGDDVESIRVRHYDALDALAGSDSDARDDADAVRAEIDALCDELADLCRGTQLLRQLTLRTRDRIVATGEKLSVRLTAFALRRAGYKAVAVDADTFLETNDRFGSAHPLTFVADRRTEASLRPLLDDSVMTVVTGFCGRAPDGATSTLGRGGSDLTATLLASALSADEVTIWTDVPGVFSADPRIVPESGSVSHLHFREAAELSHYGAKVLHPRTIIPIADTGIPVLIRSSLDPEAHGTLVDGRITPTEHGVKGVSAVKGQALVSIEGKGMAGVPGISARAFSCLGACEISVTMISQSSSESSVCIAVPGERAFDAESALKREFSRDISGGVIEDVVVRTGVGLVAAIGLGMRDTPGIAARVFAALARRHVNVLAIAQGSSELNISLAVDEAQTPEAIRGIHAEFDLGREPTSVRLRPNAPPIGVFILGCGQVGRRLARMIADLQDAGTHANPPRVIGISDRSGFVLDPDGLDRATLDGIAEHKQSGGRLEGFDGAVRLSSQSQITDACSTLPRVVLADATDDEGNTEFFCRAMTAQMDVATANKGPIACDDDAYGTLLEVRDRTGRLLFGESTVGAGLPIIRSVESVIATGDRVHRIEGCLSGTLAFVIMRMEEGLSLGSAIAEARDRGYTEPDPAIDLTGRDVARKAIILGRLSGLAPSRSVLRLEGIVGEECIGDSTTFDQRIAAMDPVLQERIRNAASDGKALRFVARIEQGVLQVGLEDVPIETPIGRLCGTSSIAIITTDRYLDDPLVIAGAGAGADVTAAGMLSDIMRISLVRGSG